MRARDMDPRIGHRTRMALTAMFGLTWTLLPMAASRLERDMPLARTHLGHVGWTAVLLGVSLAVAYWARDSMMKTALNRRMLAAALFALTAQMLLQLGAAMLGIPARAATVLHFFLWFSVAAMLTIGVERRLFPMALGYLAAFLLGARFPEKRYLLMAGSNLIMTLTVIFAWPAATRALAASVRPLAALQRAPREGDGAEKTSSAA
jgi:hypothetical protein